MPEVYKDLPVFYPKTRADWRKWLQKNHAKQTRVWLKMYKKETGSPSITYVEAVLEALCFGWIDSKANKGEDGSFYQLMAQRSPKSGWSRLNKTRVDQLVKDGLMAAPGMEVIELAKKSGTWNALDEIEELTLPADLQKALNKNKEAKKYFDAFPRSVKRGLLEWLLNAKKEETRSKRITEIVTLAAQNIRAYQYTPKK
jgi:uncharacterized protein YdeI (YjbR/CyaY-like superfamily)